MYFRKINHFKQRKNSFGIYTEKPNSPSQQTYLGKENSDPNIHLWAESKNMFNYVPTVTTDSKINDYFNSKQSPQNLSNLSKETLNPRKIYTDKENDTTLIIPDFSKENYKDQIFSNVWNFAELPQERRGSASVLQLEAEENKYTEDVLGIAKNLIFSDLSLVSWSNKDASISSHSEFVKYDTNKSEKSQIKLEKEFGIDKSPILKVDTKNIFLQDGEEDVVSECSSQDSVLYSPMNLTRYVLPTDETQELRNSKILYDKKIIQDQKAFDNPQKENLNSLELENETPEIIKKKSGKNL